MEDNNRSVRQKKVMIITNHSYMLWQFRRELIAELRKVCEVVLVMPFVGHEKDFQAMGVRCIHTELDRRSINPVTDLKLKKTYRQLLKKDRPDLVITYSIKPNIYGGMECEKLGIPFCANVQGLGTAFEKAGLAQVVTILYRRALRGAQTVFFENEANAREFQNRRIVKPGRVKLLHGAGINLEHHSLQPYPQHDVIHFLYLGRIMKEKGMDELFAAVQRLHDDGEQFMLDLVGFFEDSYRDQVEQLQAKGMVTFHGFQEDPRPFYGQADCVVLPSYHEGMSNVLLEAAAAGRPLITSDIPGCREAVDDGLTGYLVKVRDEDSLYEGMKRMLENSPEKRGEMGAAGRRKMEREFRKENVVAETMEALEME